MTKSSVMSANQVLLNAFQIVLTIRRAFRVAIATLLNAWTVVNETALINNDKNTDSRFGFIL